MSFSNHCGYSDQEYYAISNQDKIALLKEKEAVLEAKLATVRYWIESAEKAEAESSKK